MMASLAFASSVRRIANVVSFSELLISMAPYFD